MFRPQQARPVTRRGVILLVVLALLTLFAIVGISFVLYSNSQATSSTLAREAQSPLQPDMDPELAMSFFLNQLIFDVDDQNGAFSALRGHSLARSMYGYSPGATNGNNVPFNGIGRIRNSTLPPGFGGTVGPNGETLSDYHLVNYMVFLTPGNTYYSSSPGTTPISPKDGMVHDPERPGWRDPTASGQLTYFGGFNVPYTYPDLNNMFLAAVRADGSVLMPSFHRHWLFNDPGKTFNDPSNSNWTSAVGKYLTLRPRPGVKDPVTGQLTQGEMDSSFPYPEDPGGDVKNLVGSPGYYDPVSGQYANNDSIWIDLGAPVMTAPDGTRFKALFAPLIIDLDGRINLNVHGNVRGRTAAGNGAPQTALNMGFGPWEVDLQQVLTKQGSNSTYEWPSLFTGSSPATANPRYGSDGNPNVYDPNVANQYPALPAQPHFYAVIDFDGCNEQSGYIATAPMQLPQQVTLTQTSYTPFPTYPQGYGNGGPYSSSSADERTNHPANFSYFQPAGDDRAFPISNMEALLRYGDTGSPALTSDLFRLCPTNFTDNRIRNLVTTHSFDYDRPGLTAWVLDPTWTTPAYQPYQLDTTQSLYFPVGSSMGFPSQPPQTSKQSEFGSDGRALTPNQSSLLGRIDLNRPLTDYTTDYATAVQDRQNFARDIFLQLVRVTGAFDLTTATGAPSDAGPDPAANNQMKSKQFDALRALAQLAVNIVDYIDTDDNITPFNWLALGTQAFQTAAQPPLNPMGIPPVTPASQLDPNGQGWVFGTELPRLVVNEAYVEIKNDPSDTGLAANPPKATKPFIVNVWVELHNPFSTDSTLTANGAATLQTAYQLAVCADWSLPISGANPPVPSMRLARNVAGDPDNTKFTEFGPPNPPKPNVQSTVVDWTPVQPNPPAATVWGQVLPDGGAFQGTDGQNTGFSMAGPPDDFPTDPTVPAPPAPAPPTPTTRVNTLTYKVPATVLPLPPAQLPKHGLVLRRLACPSQAPQTDPTLPNYNPYVTVDYLDSVDTNDAVQYDSAGNKHPAATPGSIPNRYSVGRNQPYAAHNSQQRQQQPAVKKTNQPQHTFFQQNAEQNPPTYPPTATSTLLTPFNWLVHLDRKLVSPMELLQVSGFKPHELTQQFMQGAINTKTGMPTLPYLHRVPWFDEDMPTPAPAPGKPSHRLYRIFEFLETRPVANGVTPGGRVPGKVNINTIWDQEIFNAVVAPPYAPPAGTPDPNYTQQNVTNIWQAMVAQRTKGSAVPPIAPATNSTPAPSQGDQPFLGLATGYTYSGDKQYPNGISINNTLLRPTGATPTSPDAARAVDRMFQLPEPAANPNPLAPNPPLHPYVKDQLLTRLFGNVTTRSNVFAVWVTVGFFQVVPGGENNRPVQLGAEIGRAENRHIRHRMFAIVDRTALSTSINPHSTTQNPQFVPPIFITGNSNVTAGSGGPVSLDAAAGFYDGIPWFLQAGSNLVVDPGPSQEAVTVSPAGAQTVGDPAVGKPASPASASVSVTPNFANAHTAGFPIVVCPAASITGNTAVNIPSPKPGQSQPATISVVSLSGSWGGVTWQIQPGTQLAVDVGYQQEIVTVSNVSPAGTNPPNFTANFSKSHSQGFPIFINDTNYTNFKPGVPGNPGPQQRFDPRQNPAVVRYFSIIN